MKGSEMYPRSSNYREFQNVFASHSRNYREFQNAMCRPPAFTAGPERRNQAPIVYYRNGNN